MRNRKHCFATHLDEAGADLTATNVGEIIATRNGDEMDRLLDVCKDLAKGKDAEIIRPFHELIETLIYEFDRSGSFDWRRVSLGLPEYEREVALRELMEDEPSKAHVRQRVQHITPSKFS
ncbi:MAG: hypothetical protein ABSH52_32600 [Terriglobia bacterium]|jgi:hypothetical protein